jgi:hypothetical protein
MLFSTSSRIVPLIFRFKKLAVAYKCKFNTLYKQYTEVKVANIVLGNDLYDRKFFESIYNWWHFNNNILKNILAIEIILQLQKRL